MPRRTLPYVLRMLQFEARKASSFQQFRHDFLRELKHGVYWHWTDDPNFEIDPQRGPRDMSSLAAGASAPGKLMITSDLPAWSEYGRRPYAALIDMSKVPRGAYHQVNRGFGNEFWVEDPSQARVIQVMSRPQAFAFDRRQRKLLKINSEAELEAFYNEATSASGAKSTAQGRSQSQDALPLIRFDKVWHIGSMNVAHKGRMSFEGDGLSVSRNPKAWLRIAELGGLPLWELSKSDGRFVDWHALKRKTRVWGAITRWAQEEGWIRRGHTWVVVAPGTPENWLWGFQTRRAAVDEAEELDGRVVLRRVWKPTPKFVQRVHVPIHDINIDARILELYLRLQRPDIDGIWWEDDLDADALSAPRGVIMPERVADWSARMLVEEWEGDSEEAERWGSVGSEEDEEEGLVAPEQWGSVGSGILFVDGSDVLLLRRSDEVTHPGTWGLPGGQVPFEHRESEEGLRRSAEREAAEELGKLPPATYSGGWTLWRTPTLHFWVFRYDLAPGARARWRPALNWESSEWAWVPAAQVEAHTAEDGAIPGLKEEIRQLVPG